MFKIMVVEDDNNTRKLMCTFLKNSGFEVIAAENGEKALDIISEHRIDLIVLDIMMPGIDGYELTKSLRSVGDMIPILMVSAMHQSNAKYKGFQVGTDDYMTTPVDEEEMILRIKALLRRAKIFQDRKLTIGTTTLNYDSLSITQNNVSSTLPQKEFQLLFKLLSYPNIIFTRMQLMDEIWGFDSDTDIHTVNVHINRIRERIKDNKDFEIITVRGLGYKAERHS